MENFTPISATLGGALIGISAVLLMALSGRIAGISGIFAGIAAAPAGDRLWRLFFVIGLIAAPPLYGLFAATPPFQLAANWPLVLPGGLLVGFGTRLGSGCTSGHGVCGLARLSARSLVAVLLFVGAGMATVALTRGVLAG